jgi:hypothetical protein
MKGSLLIFPGLKKDLVKRLKNWTNKCKKKLFQKINILSNGKRNPP